jgi:8-oxo-dGTP diphosphatase
MKNLGAGIFFISDNSVLLLKNKRGIWEIPGGKRDKGEKSLAAARRETAEECGKCPSFKLIGNYIFQNKRNKYKVFYVLIDKKFKCEISEEHSDYGWFDIKNLPQPLHKKVAGAFDFLKENYLSLNNVNAV